MVLDINPDDCLRENVIYAKTFYSTEKKKEKTKVIIIRERKDWCFLTAVDHVQSGSK